MIGTTAWLSVCLLGSACDWSGSADSAALAGPKVVAAGPGLSLVMFDYAGRLVRLDRAPELVAVDRLVLDDDAARAVNGVIQARARLLDRPDRRKVPVLLELQGAIANDEVARIDAALAKLGRLNPVLASRGSLRDDLAASLTGEARTRFVAMVDAYRAAWIDEEAGGADGAEGAAIRFERAARLAEYQASYERTLGQRQADFNELLGTLNLTPEQDAAVRGAVVGVFESAARTGRASGRELLGAAGTVLWTLDRQQRDELFKQLRRRSGREHGPTPVRDHPNVALAAVTMPVFAVMGPRRKRRRGR